MTIVCSERVHTVAVAHYGQSLKARQWAEATRTRLYHGETGSVLGGLKRMETHVADTAHEVAKLLDCLGEHCHRTSYETLRPWRISVGQWGDWVGQ